LVSIKSVEPRTKQSANSSGSNSSGQNASVQDFVRVPVDKLEKLINCVGEMVILQSVVNEQSNLTGSALLQKAVHQLGKIGNEIQEISLSLRMTPIKAVFQKAQRLARDVSKELGKEVQVTVHGEETELDKNILESIVDPLTHLIRNSIDHGFESGEERTRVGKSTTCSLTLLAYHQAGKLIIEIADDGQGLNTSKIRAKAIEKGLIKSDVELKNEEIYDLIFLPGFSTKDVATEVSGRGVGMDVVRTNIQKLSGEINIQSDPGLGTTFKLILPLTLSIIDGIVTTFGNERYVFPLSHIIETFRLADVPIQKSTGIGEVINLREENITAYRLGDFFNIQSSVLTRDMIGLIFLSSKGQKTAVLVDDIVSKNQIVIKPLGPQLSGINGVSGSTILGDGNAALIIEAAALLNRKYRFLGPAHSDKKNQSHITEGVA
jgi:two-component system chemotaxis sensor kinase CheA